MTNSINRRAVFSLIGAGLLTSMVGCATAPQQPKIIDLSQFNIKSLADLEKIVEREVTRAGQKYNTEAFYEQLGETFVEYYQRALDAGKQFPDSVMDKLGYRRKVVLPVVAAPMVMFAIKGITFMIPLGPFFDLLIMSIAVIWIYIALPKKRAAIQHHSNLA